VRYLFTCSSAISETNSVAVFYVSSPFRRAHGASCSGPVCEDVFGIWLDSYSNFQVECEVVHWQGQKKLQVQYLRTARKAQKKEAKSTTKLHVAWNEGTRERNSQPSPGGRQAILGLGRLVLQARRSRACHGCHRAGQAPIHINPVCCVRS
jgi:hypothetical protein